MTAPERRVPDPLPDPDDLILIAVLPQPRDLEIARLLGWYRIPLRSAPKVVAVDYLGFYQPASFGGHRWRVEWLAQVRGHELLPRGELIRAEPDHPRAHEEYFKIQLGPLLRLPAPVQATRWKRLTFLYTTGRRLMAARTIDDLAVPPEDRLLLWRTLRERARQAGQYQVDRSLDGRLDPDLLDELLGIKALGRGESGA